MYNNKIKAQRLNNKSASSVSGKSGRLRLNALSFYTWTREKEIIDSHFQLKLTPSEESYYFLVSWLMRGHSGAWYESIGSHNLGLWQPGDMSMVIRTCSWNQMKELLPWNLINAASSNVQCQSYLGDAWVHRFLVQSTGQASLKPAWFISVKMSCYFWHIPSD